MSLYCCKCGSKSITDANFCYNCGYSFKPTAREVEEGPSTASSAASTTTSTPIYPEKKTVSFAEFRRQKENDRQSRFEPKTKKSKPNKSESRGKGKECEVSINIGYMKLDNDENLKKCRGKMLPIKLLPSAGKNEILQKAVQKHANHDKNIQEGLEHVLLNGDGNEITTLPGTEKEFVLKEYKEDIGKNYNRMTLFIALKSAYVFSEISSLKQYVDNSESDLENEKTDESVDAFSEIAGCSKIQNLHDMTELSEGHTSQVTAANQSQRSLPTSHVQYVVEDICNEQLLECPTCLQYFSVETIAEHADACCDIWIGEVQPTLASGDESDSAPATPPQLLPVTDDSKDIKDTILNIAKMLEDKMVRLNVRRKHIWTDFKEARLKGKVTPCDQVKIVFIGEPAIDDGGPRREFFSGTYTVYTVHIIKNNVQVFHYKYDICYCNYTLLQV